MEDPPKKYFRLSPGAEVRLKHAYYVTCRSVVKDAAGKVVEVHCEYDPASRGGASPDGRRVKGTLHWVSATLGRKAEIRLYDHLFNQENPDKVEEGEDFISRMNPDSLEVLTDSVVEPALADVAVGAPLQFLRMGYFCKDADSTGDHLIFNRTVSLKDGWAKVQKNQPD